MIWPDRIMVFVGGGRDPKGNPLPETEEGPFPAQVTPLRSSESISRGQPPMSRYYRLHVGRAGGDLIKPADGKVKWAGKTLHVHGDVEPWMVGGRLDHYEATLASFAP